MNADKKREVQMVIGVLAIVVSLTVIAVVVSRRAGTPTPRALEIALGDWRSDMNAGKQASDQGRFEEAEKLLLTALEKAQKIKIEPSPVPDTYNQLAELYMMQNRFTEAESYYRRALELWEKSLGPDTIQYAKAENNLGLCLFHQRRFDEAEPRYKHALEVWEKQKGVEDSDVAAALNNLAAFYKNQSRYDEAETYYARSIAIKEKTLKRGDPSLARGYNNIAQLDDAWGKYAEAQPYYEHAMRIWDKLPEYKNYADAVRESYVALLKKMDKEDDAKKVKEGGYLLPAEDETTTATLIANPTEPPVTATETPKEQPPKASPPAEKPASK